MHLIDLPEIQALLKDETDIIIDEVEGSQCFLAHAPLDVPAKNIYVTTDQRYYISIDEVIRILSTTVFGDTVTPLFDSKNNWTHIIINE